MKINSHKTRNGGFTKMTDIAVLTLFLVCSAIMTRVDACSCNMNEPYCETTERSKLILSGTILDRKEIVIPEASVELIQYTIASDEIYRQDIEAENEVVFITPLDTGLCGISYVEIGEDWVVGLSDAPESWDTSILFADACGPNRLVSALKPEELAVLEDGGNCPDPCADLGCTPVQECVVFEDGEAKCGDTCAICLPDQLCELVPVTCIITPCNFPPGVLCIDISDDDLNDDDGSMSFHFDFDDDTILY